MLKSLLKDLNRARVQYQIRMRRQLRTPLPSYLETFEPACSYCGNDSDFDFVYKPYIAGELRVVRCRCCGLKFMRPMPTTDFYHEHTGREDMAAWRSSPDSSHFDAIPESAMQQFGIRADRIFEFVSEFAPRKCRLNILEIGAAHGIILDRFRALDQEVDLYALEKNPRWEHHLQSRRIHHLNADNDPGEFDVIVMSHVLEHFMDPVDGLRAQVERLSEDGVIYIEVPNCPDVDYPYVEYKLVHTFYFTAKTLQMVCEEVGLEALKIEATNVIRSVFRPKRNAS